MKPKSLFASLLAALALTVALHAAEPAKFEGCSFVKTVGAISEYTLDSNGLTVLLMSEHSSPTLTFMVTYRVGSRNEVTGTTGATHILEHLMFKGSDAFNDRKGNSVKQFLESIGGNYNATTWLDRTNYYANIGNDHLAGYMAIEADRMRNLWLHDSDRKPEMTVVRNEFERGENSPFQSLIKEIFAAAFVAHPYHHSTIGHRSDIENVPIEKLRAFYDTFYWPDNATVSVIGDFEPAAAVALVKKYYGVYPRAPHPIPQLYTTEPAQTGPRHVTVKRAGQLGVVAVAHKIPAGTHADFAAINVLSAILADGKNSRLYHALTDKNLSTGVQNVAFSNHDPSLHFLFVPLAPDATHEQVEKIVFEEIEKVKQDGVTDTEVQAAVAKFLADSAYQRDGSFAIAGNLNECIAAGDWTLFYTVEEATKKVTAAEVKRVAHEYFGADQSTAGWFIPTATAHPPAPKAAAQAAAK
jgi:zinc protease